jgi:predicted RNA-binding protein with PUA-like domain
MPGYWILKSEPSNYAYTDLERDGRTVWDGVRNAQALIHIRSMKKGDQALFYHTGDQKAITGLARIASDPYSDPRASDPKLAVVDLVPDKSASNPVPLSAIKADPEFATLGLVRHSRLSIVPVPADQWNRLLRMAGLR